MYIQKVLELSNKWEKNKSERYFIAFLNPVRSFISQHNYQYQHMLLFKSPYARCRLVYHGVLTISPTFLQLAKEPLLLFYVELENIIRLLLSFVDYFLIPPYPHLAFHLRYFLAMNTQMFHNSYHRRSQKNNPAFIHYQSYV